MDEPQYNERFSHSELGETNDMDRAQNVDADTDNDQQLTESMVVLPQAVPWPCIVEGFILWQNTTVEAHASYDRNQTCDNEEVNDS